MPVLSFYQQRSQTIFRKASSTRLVPVRTITLCTQKANLLSLPHDVKNHLGKLSCRHLILKGLGHNTTGISLDHMRVRLCNALIKIKCWAFTLYPVDRSVAKVFPGGTSQHCTINRMTASTSVLGAQCFPAAGSTLPISAIIFGKPANFSASDRSASVFTSSLITVTSAPASGRNLFRQIG